MADQIALPRNSNYDERRHWSPDSQPYAPADVLVAYLNDGWDLEKLAAVESFWHSGVRRSDIYYFTLTRGDRRLEMPVLANPTVLRVIEAYKLSVVRVNGGPEL